MFLPGFAFKQPVAAEFSKLICLLPVSITAQNTALISEIYRFTVCSSLSFLGLAAAFPINHRLKQHISLLHIICQQSPFMVWKYFIILFAVWLRRWSPLDLVSFLWKVLDISVSLRYTITVLRAKLNKINPNNKPPPKTTQSLQQCCQGWRVQTQHCNSAKGKTVPQVWPRTCQGTGKPLSDSN